MAIDPTYCASFWGKKILKNKKVKNYFNNNTRFFTRFFLELISLCSKISKVATLKEKKVFWSTDREGGLGYGRGKSSFRQNRSRVPYTTTYYMLSLRSLGIQMNACTAPTPKKTSSRKFILRATESPVTYITDYNLKMAISTYLKNV